MRRRSREELGTYTMPVARQGYPEGFVLRNVPLREARAMECNRCGDCCDTRHEGVDKDEGTGLPLFCWEAGETASGPGSQTADPHRYDDRMGTRLILPVIEVEGQLVIGEDFDRDADDNPYTSFSCAAYIEYPEGPEGPPGGCGIYGVDGKTERRPLNCGNFPVFGLEVDDSIINNGSYVPPTGHQPRCTWYGIRLVGPWKE